MQRPKTRYAKCGDLHIANQVIGDGPIDLLYAQGWLSNVESVCLRAIFALSTD